MQQDLEQVSLMSLDQELESYIDEFPNILSHKQPVALLSQIRQIDRHIVELLEKTGIYDTDDFFRALSDLRASRLIPQSQIDDISVMIDSYLQKTTANPRVILSFPSNYAFITVFNYQSTSYLGLYWRGLFVRYQKTIVEDWKEIGKNLEGSLQKMNYPELIGRVYLDFPPHWLETVVPFSTYVSNIPLDPSLVDTALEWGFPAKLLDTQDLVEQHLSAQLYLFHLATYSD